MILSARIFGPPIELKFNRSLSLTHLELVTIRKLNSNLLHIVIVTIVQLRNMKVIIVTVWATFGLTTTPICPSKSTGMPIEVRPRTEGTTHRNSDPENRTYRDNLYSCVTWSPRLCHYGGLRLAHHNLSTIASNGERVNTLITRFPTSIPS